MDNILAFSLTVFMGFFAITNPLSNLTVFLSVTDGADEDARKRIGKKAVWTAFIVGLIFILLGQIIFNLFGITVPAFQITGGILVFVIGFDMINSKKTAVKRLAKVHISEDIAISPMAVPLIAGPGTIVTAMNFVSDANWLNTFVVIAIFALVMYLNYLAFLLSKIVIRRLGRNILAVIGKLMGLILAIIGTGMIVEGLRGAFPILSKTIH